MIERRAHVLAPLTAAALIAQQVGSNAFRDGLFLSAFPVTSLPYFMAAAAVLAVPAAHASGRLLTRFGPIRVVPAVLATERGAVPHRVGAARLAAAGGSDRPLSPLERARGDRDLGVLVAAQRAVRRAFSQAADDPRGRRRDVRRARRRPRGRARGRAAATRRAPPRPRRGGRRLRCRSLGPRRGRAAAAHEGWRGGRKRRLDPHPPSAPAVESGPRHRTGGGGGGAGGLPAQGRGGPLLRKRRAARAVLRTVLRRHRRLGGPDPVHHRACRTRCGSDLADPSPVTRSSSARPRCPVSWCRLRGGACCRAAWTSRSATRFSAPATSSCTRRWRRRPSGRPSPSWTWRAIAPAKEPAPD